MHSEQDNGNWLSSKTINLKPLPSAVSLKQLSHPKNLQQSPSIFNRKPPPKQLSKKKQLPPLKELNSQCRVIQISAKNKIGEKGMKSNDKAERFSSIQQSENEDSDDQFIVKHLKSEVSPRQ